MIKLIPNMMSVIQNTNNNVSTHKNQQGNLWILDTRATDHVTYDLNHFSTLYRIKPVTVRFPNNSIFTTEFVGTKPFSNSFIIFNVLYIPEFSFNLIFVQSLV